MAVASVDAVEFNAMQDRLAECVPRLLATLEAVLELAAQHEQGAQRWAEPLPVPQWVTLIRSAVSRELLRGEPGGDRS
jgi:hypothetical protein